MLLLFFFHNFNLNLEKAMEVTKNYITIVGDLNKILTKEFLPYNGYFNYGLADKLNSLTGQQAILDPIIIPDDMPFLDSGTIDVFPISDHKTMYIRVPTTYQRNLTYTRLVWLYKRANFALLRQ